MSVLKIRLHRLLAKHLSGEAIDYRQIVALFIPLLIDQIFLGCLNILNTAMISSSGVAAVSAVSMIDTLNMFLISVFVAISTGGTVIVAQYKGSGNNQMISRGAATSVSLVTSLACAISLIMIACNGPVLRVVFGAASADVIALAQVYMIGSCISYIGFAVVESVNGVMRGIGRTRVSLALSLTMNLSYFAMNFICINLLNLGVLGMTIAANTARYGAAAFALFYLFKLDTTLYLRFRELFRVNVAMIRKILFIGFPFAMEQMFFNGGKMLTQVFIVSLGTYAMATNAICSSIAALFLVPSLALSQTTVTVVGQCMGRQNVRDARKFTKVFLWLSSASLLLMGLIIMPLFEPIVGLFHPPAEIVPDIFVILLMVSIVQIVLWPISFVLPSALRAAGDSKFTSIAAMLSMWLFRLTLGYILGIAMGYGIVGVWVAMNLEWGVRGGVFVWRFLGTKWYRHRLVEPAAK